MAKVISGAVQTDADICNRAQVDPPRAGVHIGGGSHVVIPSDWFARCVAGQKIVGCNYAQVELDGTMFVSSQAEANQAIPANVVGAIGLVAFQAKLALGVVVSAAIAESAEVVP